MRPPITTVGDLIAALQQLPLDARVNVQFDINDHDTLFRISDVREVAVSYTHDHVVVIEAA